VKHPVTLDIAGAQFRLVTDADAQHMHALAALVNERVAKLQANTNRTFNTTQLLALVALGLADDLNSSERKLRDMEQLTRNTIQNVITRIDTRLSSTQPDGQAAPTHADADGDAEEADSQADRAATTRPAPKPADDD
jgi:cell division protein ZapA (FtsZ GTPase activity inhibitor)